jgi:hypothetical protein
MIFDVMIREGYNDKGKQIISISRIRDISLNLYLRKVQDEKKYIISVTPLVPLFKRIGGNAMYVNKTSSDEAKQIIEMREQVDQIDPDAMIDPHGF